MQVCPPESPAALSSQLISLWATLTWGQETKGTSSTSMPLLIKNLLMVRGASIPWERNSNFHFEWKLLRCVPEGKKKLCSFGFFSLTLQTSFHLCFHAQYAHYSVIHSVWVTTATMPICSGPLLNVFVKTQPCDVTAWVTAAWGKCGWQLCLSKQPISCFQMCSQPTQPVWEKLTLVGMATVWGCLIPLDK